MKKTFLLCLTVSLLAGTTAMAQFNLGWINVKGLMSSEGLMQDMDVAKAWFEQSAKLGFKDAIEVLEKNF